MIMSHKSVVKGDGSAAFQFLYGGKIIPKRIALRGMVALERELKARSLKDWARQQDVTKHLNKIYAPLRKLSDDKAVTEAFEGLRTYRARFLKQKASPPKARKETQRIYVGSLAALISPPYDYEWKVADPPPPGGSVLASANRSSGRFGFGIGSFQSEDFNCRAAAGVGIYFRPVTRTGRLAIWSDPSFNDSWDDRASFASSHSDGFIGLYIASFDNNGNFTGAVVDQRNGLWSDDSHFGGEGPNQDSNPGYPLYSACSVDNGHQYIIWVWAGGRAAADAGIGIAWASSEMSVIVPSITWELT
jgi:hypothetical protein